MINENSNPVIPPVNNPGQVIGNPPQGGQKPPAADNNQPSGGVKNQEPQTTNISLEELNNLKRKAGRWDAGLKRKREDRRNNKGRSRSDYDADNADPALLDAMKERDDKIDELSSVNIKLQVKDKVRDLLDSDEYKDISPTIRRAIGRNPLGFANSSAQSVEDATADIQEYLDDELDRLASMQPPAQGGGQPTGNQLPVGTPLNQSPAGQQTPPASGSGPSNPETNPNQGIDGKVGSKRSTQVLQNILKGPRR